METRKVLLAAVIGLIAADAYILLAGPGEPPPRTPPKTDYHVGQDLDVVITLVSTDAKSLACAGTEEVGGRHCAFENQTTPWTKPAEGTLPPAQTVLAPYKTTDDVMFLVPGLFSEPALVERLKIDPPTFGQEHMRFIAHCKVHVEGKMQKFDVRWQTAGPWYPGGDSWIGTVSGCSVSEP